MSFTSWADLRKKMLDDMADGSWMMEEYTIGNIRVKYRTFQEFQSALEYVSYMADMEEGKAVSRVIAKNGGGRW